MLCNFNKIPLQTVVLMTYRCSFQQVGANNEQTHVIIVISKKRLCDTSCIPCSHLMLSNKLLKFGPEAPTKLDNDEFVLPPEMAAGVLADDDDRVRPMSWLALGSPRNSKGEFVSHLLTLSGVNLGLSTGNEGNPINSLCKKCFSSLAKRTETRLTEATY